MTFYQFLSTNLCTEMNLQIMRGQTYINLGPDYSLIAATGHDISYQECYYK
jgi:hypothetical protein